MIVQFGGQTPLKLAAGLEAAGVPLLGTSPEAIDLAEDRGRFGALLDRLGAQGAALRHRARRATRRSRPRPASASRCSCARATCSAGARWSSSTTSRRSRDYLQPRRGANGGPEIFLDRFLENAIEVDVDAICDGEDVWIGGIMQHVEEAGIHSGDSACVLPPHSLGGEMLRRDPGRRPRAIALELGVVGLMNVQYARRWASDLYVIEANPRASRTVPFVSKATGLPLAKLACRVMLGERLRRRWTCRRTRAATTSRSRRRCCRSTASPARTRCSGPRCAPPAR